MSHDDITLPGGYRSVPKDSDSAKELISAVTRLHKFGHAITVDESNGSIRAMHYLSCVSCLHERDERERKLRDDDREKGLSG